MSVVPAALPLLFMAVRIVGTPPAHQDEEARALVRLAQHIDSRDARYRNIEVRCHARGPGETHLVVSVVYVKPRCYTMYISDGSLGRPIAFVSNGKMALYDPITDTLLYASNAVVNWSLGVRDDRLRYAVFFFRSKEGGDFIDLDIRSFFEGATTDLEIQATGENRYRMVRTSLLGDSVEAAIDTRRYCAFTRLEVSPKGEARPVLCLDRIRLDEEIDAMNFTFPDRKALEDCFRMFEWTDEGLLTTARALATIKRVAMVRAVSQNPMFKGTPEFADLKGVDWQLVEKNDRKASAKLKDLFRWPIIGDRSPPASAPAERRHP
jgi:hypothetical protein